MSSDDRDARDETATTPAPNVTQGAELGRTPGIHGTRRGFLTSAALALTAVAGGVGVTRAAAADDGSASPETAEQAAWWAQDGDMWQRQNLLDDLKAWIVAQPGIENSGYIESVNNPDQGSTILLWQGPANQLQQQIKDRARKMGIPVTVEQRKYGRADVDRAQQAIKESSGKGAFINFRINAIGGVTADFDGIIVYGEYIAPSAGGRAAADVALAEAATAEFGIAIAIERGGNIMPA